VHLDHPDNARGAVPRLPRHCEDCDAATRDSVWGESAHSVLPFIETVARILEIEVFFQRVVKIFKNYSQVFAGNANKEVHVVHTCA
jgi:hypothetical protein